MFSGEKINVTEQRAVLHVALRAPKGERIVVDGADVVADVHALLDRMAAFSDRIRSGQWLGHTGKRIRNVVNIGLGGSDLGPVMAYQALRHYSQRDLRLRFVSNVDGTDFVEATHDLDPEGAERIRALIADLAARDGSAVLWATQRLDEIRGFADEVTLLAQGRAAFQGTVPELMAQTISRRYLLRLRNARAAARPVEHVGRVALGDLGTLDCFGMPPSEHYLPALREDVVLGDAVAALAAAHVDVLACRQERSEIEEAFLALTGDRG
jgi:hypothetical protein